MDETALHQMNDDGCPHHDDPPRTLFVFDGEGIDGVLWDALAAMRIPDEVVTARTDPAWYDREE